LPAQGDIALSTASFVFEIIYRLPDRIKRLKQTLKNIIYFNQEINMFKITNPSKVQHRFGRTLVLTATVLSMLLLAGCISSAKVYNNDKTVVYNGAIYNLGNVKQVKPTISGKLSDTNTVDLRAADKKQIEAYLKEYGSIYVRMAYQFDDQEMLYRASEVKKWSEYSKMKSSFDNAGKQINSLMANKKKLQVKLK
jgi:uncharacterized protein YcfL